MTVSLFQRLQVKDFDTWLNPDPDAVRQEMTGQGVLAYSLHRNPDDPNALMVHYQFADQNTLNSFVTSYEAFIAQVEASSPHKPENLEWWVGVDIPSHTSI